MRSQIPRPDHPFLDKRTGLIDKTWYKYLGQFAVDVQDTESAANTGLTATPNLQPIQNDLSELRRVAFTAETADARGQLDAVAKRLKTAEALAIAAMRAPPSGQTLTFATTTEQLTGTATDRVSSPDSVAALWEKGSNITSGATISIGEGGFFHVTGTTTITDIDFGTDKSGRPSVLVFDDVLTLTHNATTLILPTAANITTAAGDIALVWSEGSDAVRVAYFRKNGTALAGGGSGSGNFGVIAATEYTSNDTWTKNASSQLIYVEVVGGGASGGSGAAGTNAANRTGGGGGSAGAVTARWFRAADISSPVSVTVGGAQNTVGTGVTGTNVGVAGSNGNPSSFGAYLAAAGGTGGSGGTAGGSPATVQSQTSLSYLFMNGVAGTTFNGNPGAGAGGNGVTGLAGFKGGLPETFGGPGGGSQAPGVSTVGAVAAGLLGGAGHASAGKGMFQQTSLNNGEGGGTVGPVSTGTAAIAASDTSYPWFGDGGPSGGSSATTNGGAGASGAAPGGGGGGGGACRNTHTSGAGGAGARGAVRVIEYG